MAGSLQKIRSLLKLSAAVRNPAMPLLDRFGFLRRPYQASLRDGAVFELRPGRGDWPSVNGAYVWNCYLPVEKPLLPGDNVIDIGANIGAFTVLAARAVGSTGKVIALEPAGDTFAQLERNLFLNGLKNVTAKRAAGGESPGIATLHVARNAVYTSFYPDIAAQSVSDGVENVPVVTIGQLMDENGWKRCNYLKLDCEGAEHGIIRGMSAETASKIDRIGMEIHKVEGIDSAATIERLKSFGFSMQCRGQILSFRRE